MSPDDGIMSTVFGSHAEVKVGSTAGAVKPAFLLSPAVRKPVMTAARRRRHPLCAWPGAGRLAGPGAPGHPVDDRSRASRGTGDNSPTAVYRKLLTTYVTGAHYASTGFVKSPDQGAVRSERCRRVGGTEGLGAAVQCLQGSCCRYSLDTTVRLPAGYVVTVSQRGPAVPSVRPAPSMAPAGDSGRCG
jgi:hypothetical protein